MTHTAATCARTFEPLHEKTKEVLSTVRKVTKLDKCAIMKLITLGRSDRKSRKSKFLGM